MSVKNRQRASSCTNVVREERAEGRGNGRSSNLDSTGGPDMVWVGGFIRGDMNGSVEEQTRTGPTGVRLR